MLSQYQHQKTRSGIISAIILREQPEGIAGVIPTILSFCFASSIIVLPNTSWYNGGAVMGKSSGNISPVSLSNLPGA